MSQRRAGKEIIFSNYQKYSEEPKIIVADTVQTMEVSLQKLPQNLKFTSNSESKPKGFDNLLI